MSAAAPGFVGGLLNFVDAQAQAIGAGGYQALSAPGSTLSLILAGLLTLFVAFFGYRMLFGQTPDVRDGVMALVKIGIVLALATSWTLYRTLVYDVAFKAPAELAADIGRPAGVPGAGGGLVARLDHADRLLLALIELGEGRPAGPQAAPPPPYLTPGPATGVPAAAPNPEAEGSGSAGLFFGGARILYLTGAAGAFAALRLIAAVLLALGPFFFAFLLFDGTRGLFAGWLRVLAGTALGALGTAIALGVELALIEPRLAYLIALRNAGYAIPGAAIELFVIALIFALALIAMLAAAARVAWGFDFPAAWRAAPARVAGTLQGEEARFAFARAGAGPEGERSRAAAIADAVAASQRREAGPVVARGAAGADAPRSAPHAPSTRDEAPPPLPLGQSHRRTRNRASASAGRRDVRR